MMIYRIVEDCYLVVFLFDKDWAEKFAEDYGLELSSFSFEVDKGTTIYFGDKNE